MSEHNHLRSTIARGLEKGKSSVDRDNNIIYGYAVMTKGHVKDMRGWEIDDDTLEGIVKSGNSYKRGVKSRFGHPNMSNTAFGTYLGLSKNFRRDGDVVRADLHLSDNAFDTPSGDLGTYVLNMAEKDPDQFGTSVVLSDWSLARRTEKDGTPKKDQSGNELPPVLRIKKISASDVVDDPAANNGMFATQFYNETVMPSAAMTDFLDKFLSNSDAVENTIAFLQRYQTHRTETDPDDKPDEETKINTDGGEKAMESNLKNLTVDQLREQRPDLVDQFKNEFSTQPAPAAPDPEASQGDLIGTERTRALKILKLVEAPELEAYRNLASQAISEGLSVEAAENRILKARHADLNAHAPETPGPSNPDEDSLNTLPDGEEKWKAEFEKSEDLQGEFGSVGRYVAFKKAEKNGQINISKRG